MKAGERVPLEVRFTRRRRIVTASGCWEWTGHVDRTGYGRMTIEKRLEYVHRIAWMHYTGREIPAGMVMDHICENRVCFNPKHLQLVTHQVNTNSRRNAQATRTHCPHGHRYAGDNVRVYVDRRGYPHRICVTCQNIRNAAWRAR